MTTRKEELTKLVDAISVFMNALAEVDVSVLTKADHDLLIEIGIRACVLSKLKNCE